jgi:hypothetical protein
MTEPAGIVDPAARSGRGPTLAWVAFGLAVLGTVAALFLPLGQECGEGAVEPGQQLQREMTCRNVSTWQIGDGRAVAVAGTIPVLLAAMPLPLGRYASGRASRFVSAALLTAFCVIALISIGIFYLPAATVMWVAGAVRDGTRPRPDRVELPN